MRVPFLLSLMLFAASAPLIAADDLPAPTVGSLDGVTVPSQVYVADFLTADTEVKKQKRGLFGHPGGLFGGDGILGGGGEGGGIFGGHGPLGGDGMLNGGQPAPEDLVPVVRNAIIEGFNKAKVSTAYFDADGDFPASGWLVEGDFTSVDNGGRVKRAVIGFGVGACDVQISVAVSDLGRDPRKPFLLFAQGRTSGNMPGGLLLLNPYVMAAKFVLSKNATSKDAKKLGGEIAKAIVVFMKEHSLLPPGADPSSSDSTPANTDSSGTLTTPAVKSSKS
jgi:hypothetical protein